MPFPAPNTEKSNMFPKNNNTLSDSVDKLVFQIASKDANVWVSSLGDRGVRYKKNICDARVKIKIVIQIHRLFVSDIISPAAYDRWKEFFYSTKITTYIKA
jgi:hypothetical protein